MVAFLLVVQFWLRTKREQADCGTSERGQRLLRSQRQPSSKRILNKCKNCENELMQGERRESRNDVTTRGRDVCDRWLLTSAVRDAAFVPKFRFLNDPVLKGKTKEGMERRVRRKYHCDVFMLAKNASRHHTHTNAFLSRV